MATDKTRFEDLLKANLAWDLAFRIGVWSALALATTQYASAGRSFESIEYLNRVIGSLLPVMNSVTVVAGILAGIALLMKDLEQVAPETWGQATFRGFVGGIVRRLAGDLTLWVIGALVTLLCVLSFTTLDLAERGASAAAVGGVGAAIILPVIGIVALGWLNVLVRRAAPPFATYGEFVTMLKRPWHVFVLYGSLIALVLVTSQMG